MSLETLGRFFLFIDLVAVAALVVIAWQDLQKQRTDLGKIGGVTAIIALWFVFYFIGRAFLGV